MNRTFLLVGETTGTQWSLALQRALAPMGKLHVRSGIEAIHMTLQEDYDMIFIDAGVVCDTTLLTSHLRAQQPETRVVIATASPTWRRAREALQAGAADYIRKSLNEKKLRARIQAVLDTPPPSWPR